MDNGVYIALLNPSIALVLASAFLVLWLHQRQRRYIAVLALGYAASAAAFLMQYFTLPADLAVTKLVANGLFITAALCIAGAIVGRYRRPLPVTAFAVLGGGGLGALSWFLLVDPDLTWRIYVVNFALGGISLLVAAELRAVPRKTAVDRILFGVSLLAGLNFFVRTLVTVHMHGPYQGFDGLFTSIYWTTAILTHAILSVVIALTLVTSTALDVIAELRRESQTDLLSGLLNRRGFEEQASMMLADTHRHGLPVSLVICDLDHFKAVNDSLGHVAGDRVISAFASFLRTAASDHHAAGRLGGEEFAIILPGTNLPAARLFAEGTRGAFASLRVDGLPQDRRFTASFGVAELLAGESIAELLGRADAALYEAKNSGRDCVRVSQPGAARTLRQIAG